jgi:glycosyltransferase involved in cell wall biosynthesis
MAPEITVLMPVHNGEAFVREASESILSQTFQDLELLVVDDASTDQTVKILESLNDPRVRIIKSRERLRFSGALNLGIEHATGTFLARMDGDDIALPSRLALQHDYMLTHPHVGLCGGLATTFGMREGLFFRPPLSHGEIVSYMLFDCPFVHPTVIFRRDFMERYRLRYDSTYCPTDDYELWRRAARLFPVANINQVLLHYRVHASSLTQSEWGDMDGHAARIAALELADLGVTTSADELYFHRNLGRGRCFPIKRRDELERAEAWLHKLLNANAQSKRYPASEFARIVAGIWFSACYHAGALGLWMPRRYARSPLRRVAATSFKEWTALFHVAARHISQ